MCTYLTNNEASWMTKDINTSSLVVMHTLKAKSFTILILGRQSSSEMSYSKKKNNGIGDNIMKTTTSFHTSKKMIWSIQG